jgi:hypothetical protein
LRRMMSKSYIERYLKEPSTSYFLFGPRGTKQKNNSNSLPDYVLDQFYQHQ